MTLLARQRDRLEATAASASVEGPVASSGSGQIALTWTPAGASSDAMREPLRRMSQPEDIAGTVAWLLSPDARGVTGQAIDQNGGAWVG